MTIFLRSSEKKFWRHFFLGNTCALRPCFLALAESLPVLGLKRVCPQEDGAWPWPRIVFVTLALTFVSSTPPLTVLLSSLFY